MKEQIEELIYKGKLQRFVKKDEPGQMKQNARMRLSEEPKDKDHPEDYQGDTIGERRMINGGPITGESFRSLKKA